MLLAACLAYLWMICQGLWVVDEKKTGLIDRTDRIDKSLFRLGLDWIKYAIKRDLDIEPVFRFQPIESTVNVRWRIRHYFLDSSKTVRCRDLFQ
jgi:hypothetical protein